MSNNITPKKLVGVGRFVDAVVLARDIFNSNGQLLTRRPVNVNPELVAVVSNHTDLSFQILELDVETSRISGLTINYPKKTPLNSITDEIVTPQILLSSTNSVCWDRFTVCKEIMYYYLGFDGKTLPPNKGEVGEDLVAKLQSISGSFWGIEKESELDIEHFTFCIAIELLLPWAWREEIHQMKVVGFTHLQIASIYKVPEDIIYMYFDTNYRELSVASNTDLVT